MAKSISWLLGTGLLALAGSVAGFLLVANVRYAAVDRAAAEIVESVTEVTEHSLPLAMAAKDLRYHVVQVQQWLTDVSATRAAEGFADGFDKAAAHAGTCRDLFARFESDAAVQRADRERLAELRSAFESYYAVGTTMANAYVAGGPARGNAMMATFDAAAERITTAVDGFVDELTSRHAESLQAVAARATVTRQHVHVGSWLLWGAIAMPFVAAIVLYQLLRRGVVLPLQRLLAQMARIAVGDLTVRCEPQTVQELVALAEGIDAIISGLAEMVDGLVEAAAVLQSQAELAATASDQLAQQSSSQAAALQEISATMEEVRGQATSASDHARRVGDDSRGTREVSERGQRELQHLVAAIGAIQRGSEEVAKVMGVIDQIALQTNMLALNAAVEASRAGDAGRGFAVVAEEVRALAQRSATSASDSSRMIAAANASAQQGGALASQVANVFGDVLAGTRKVDDMVAEIVGVAGRQQESIQSVGQALHSIDGAVQQNARRAEELAQVVRSSREQVELLRVAVGRFRFEAKQPAIDQHTLAHYATSRRSFATAAVPATAKS